MILLQKPIHPKKLVKNDYAYEFVTKPKTSKKVGQKRLCV